MLQWTFAQDIACDLVECISRWMELVQSTNTETFFGQLLLRYIWHHHRQKVNIQISALSPYTWHHAIPVDTVAGFEFGCSPLRARWASLTHYDFFLSLNFVFSHCFPKSIDLASCLHDHQGILVWMFTSLLSLSRQVGFINPTDRWPPTWIPQWEITWLVIPQIWLPYLDLKGNSLFYIAFWLFVFLSESSVAKDDNEVC